MLRTLPPLAIAAILSWMPDAVAHGPLHEEILNLTEALDRQPENAALLERRGELYRIHGLYSEAQADWTRLAGLRPDDSTNDLRLGLLALDQKETNAALERLERFVQAHPGSLPAQLSAAEACRLAGRAAESVRHWTAAIRMDPEPKPDWYLQRAKAARDAGDPAAAILAGLDEGIARYGPLPALQLPAVDIEVQRGDIEAALRRLSAIAARADRKERWLVRRGDVLLAAGRTNDARIEYTAAQEALDQLPEKVRRGWTATELRQMILEKLKATTPGTTAAPRQP